MLESILSTTAAGGISLPGLLICTAASFLLGIGIAYIYMFRNTYSKNFVITLALLPAMVQAVITLVNGNLGTGVAVLGAFSLIRFRSVPGGAREIGSIFFAMAAGLAASMGYLAYAFLFLIFVGAMTILLSVTPFGEQRSGEKDLKIILPENLSFQGLFDDLFTSYTIKADLITLKTTNMGSLFELHYRVMMKDSNSEKEFIDALRCRNGNLTISLNRIDAEKESL